MSFLSKILERMGCLIVSLFFISCNEADSSLFTGDEIEQINDWKNYQDTLSNGLIVSFDYPSFETNAYRVEEDFIIESSWMSHDNEHRVGIFYKELKLEKLDSLILYEQTLYDFEMELVKDSIIIDNQTSLRVRFINKNDKSLKFRRIYLIKKDVIFEILDSNAEVEFYNKVINSIRIS